MGLIRTPCLRTVLEVLCTVSVSYLRYSRPIPPMIYCPSFEVIIPIMSSFSLLDRIGYSQELPFAIGFQEIPDGDLAPMSKKTLFQVRSFSKNLIFWLSRDLDTTW